MFKRIAKSTAVSVDSRKRFNLLFMSYLGFYPCLGSDRAGELLACCGWSPAREFDGFWDWGMVSYWITATNWYLFLPLKQCFCTVQGLSSACNTNSHKLKDIGRIHDNTTYKANIGPLIGIVVPRHVGTNQGCAQVQSFYSESRVKLRNLDEGRVSKSRVLAGEKVWVQYSSCPALLLESKPSMPALLYQFYEVHR